MEDKKKKVTVIIISILIILILLLALTYAYFSTQLSGKDQIVKVGELELVLDETSEGISLDNAIGISDSKGMSLEGSTFELINNGSNAVDYTIYLDDNTIGETDTRIDDKYLKYNLNKNGSDSGAYLLTSIGSNPNRILDSGTIEGKSTNEYSLNLWITDEVDGNYSGQVFSGKLRVEVSQDKPEGVDVLIDKANDPSNNDYNSSSLEEQKEMYVFNHSETYQTEALTDYRYIGSNPNNYVIFNNEVWRIIGVFPVVNAKGETENRIKIVRDEHIGRYSWDNKNMATGAEDDFGKNDWSDARLMKLLNSGYENEEVGGSLYYNRGSGTCYSGSNNATVSCDFSESGLSEEAKSMTSKVVWYLGGKDNRTTSNTGEDDYIQERSNQVTNTRPLSWLGEVGLIYISDYTYTFANGVSDSCYNTIMSCNVSEGPKSWFYKRNIGRYTIVHRLITSRDIYNLQGLGNISFGGAAGTHYIYPTLYLNSNIKITSGDGSSENPYRLSI